MSHPYEIDVLLLFNTDEMLRPPHDETTVLHVRMIYQ